MTEEFFRYLPFEEAVFLAETSPVEAVQDHSGHDGRDLWEWHANGLLVRLDEHGPCSVQLVGTLATVFRAREEEAR